MDDCLFVAAMGPPGGGRNLITSRYGRHFNHISIVDFDDATLKRIFSTILGWHLAKETFQQDIQVCKGNWRHAWRCILRLLCPLFESAVDHLALGI